MDSQGAYAEALNRYFKMHVVIAACKAVRHAHCDCYTITLTDDQYRVPISGAFPFVAAMLIQPRGKVDL